MEIIERKANRCPCGNERFEKEFNWANISVPLPIWICTNCGEHSLRRVTKRKTLKQMSFDAWIQMKKEWEEVDADILQLIEDKKVPSGWYLVYHSHACHYINLIHERSGTNTRDGLRSLVNLVRKDLWKAQAKVREAKSGS